MNPAALPPASIVIASRESALAMWQAEHIRERLATLYPQTAIRILGMTTQGDQILDRPLAKIGGKGLFIKELEQALEEGRADIAVHSMKDVPMVLPEGFMIAAITEREDPRDAFVSGKYAGLEDLPEGAVVGTSSLRRESQLRSRFPHLKVEPLRGNVQTRLRKLDEGMYDAIILAAAGLKRLGLGERIRSLIAPSDSLPAVGQGALGIECRSDRPEFAQILSPLYHERTAQCVIAEREVSRALGGSCQVPLGAFATIEQGVLRLDAFVASPDGREMIRASEQGDPADHVEIGRRVAEMLRADGADAILERLI
ncbi:MAG: hydroxymethylbilane synthase [Burkholderiales bacterium]|nr:hydroxymethylbilane synthase [Burkholderiales bacterium]